MGLPGAGRGFTSEAKRRRGAVRSFGTRGSFILFTLCSQQCYQHALRRDPDCAPAMRALKKLRAVTGGKERGEEVPWFLVTRAPTCLLACGRTGIDLVPS